MTISYNWLSDYLPLKLDPDKLSRILTSVGLEVEKMTAFEEVKGGMKGLVVGKVLRVEPHPNADKLKLTLVDIGQPNPLQIVCGAANVEAGQKVIVASVGTTIYPISGEPQTMKVAKIRNVESYGMICAEDEIGLGTSHEGIMVLPQEIMEGTPAAEFFKPFTDIIYEIGLTPNRMEAMSHWGVARDVCAYLTHHEKKEFNPLLPPIELKKDKEELPIKVTVENKEACKRYSGICIAGVKVTTSPRWLQHKLKSIGIRTINNIVDITNFILHETGQPLHAFDYDTLKEHRIIVKTLPGGTLFTTLDEKERKLSSEDLMICDATDPLCIAGVFGGISSGIKETTTNIFLESAWFDPVYIRKTSFRHQLRTDAAIRFEKNIDISNTVTILIRAAMLIKEVAGGKIASDIIDIYPAPLPKKEISLSSTYVKKLSGKEYSSESINTILTSLGFSIRPGEQNSFTVKVPYHKPDVSMPADLVEEIVRIDGLDNIDIPSSITISPSIEPNYKKGLLKEKTANILAGLGFTEILTNSITNSAFFSNGELAGAVKLINNLSSELDIMRPSMLHTALEVIRFNNNRKNHNLSLFEFGKTYQTIQTGVYVEKNHLCLYLTGTAREHNWNIKARNSDIYYLKGVAMEILSGLGRGPAIFLNTDSEELDMAMQVKEKEEIILTIGKVNQRLASLFDLKQPVFFADFNWDLIINNMGGQVQYKEIAKYPSVERDLALIVPREMNYQHIIDQIVSLRLHKLQSVNLFDVFESEKLGPGKKSMAFKFIFLDTEKTLTDKEIDSWINKIIITLEKELKAEIRK